MKKTHFESSSDFNDDELLPEYRFDYTQAKPNRFANRERRNWVVVTLDEDVAHYFKTSEAVNQALRTLIEKNTL